MWTFLNPLFLWAGAAALIPLLLHLLQKRRTVKLHFSTLRFLKLAQQRSASRIRLENLLLWFLRTLLLLAIALAFALPVLRTGALGNLLGTAQRDIAIVWDVGYSMSYDSGRAPVWDDARDTITDIVNGLESGDRVCIFLADEDVIPLIEQPTSDLELALSLVKDQQFKPTTSRLRPAINAAIQALNESGKRERELYVITDGQALPWSDVEKTGDDNAPITWFVALLGPDSPINNAITDVEIQPATLLTNSEIKIRAKLLPTSAQGATTVTLFVDEQEVARRSAQTDAEFPLPALPEGIHVARLETPADGVMLDNAFHFLLRVRDQVPVLVIGSEADSFFLERALNPRGKQAWSVTRLDPGTSLPDNMNDFRAVFLCNALPLPGQLVLDLERYVRGGGVLMLFPGDNARAGDYASWNSLPAKPAAIEDLEAKRFSLRLDAPTDPLFRSIKLPSGTIPSVTIRRMLQFPSLTGETNMPPADSSASGASTLAPDSQILLSVAGSPFLLSRTVGEGRVLLASVSADRRWSDLPLSAFFLPLVHQVVQVRAGAGDQPFRWAAAELPVPFAENVTGPDGKAIQIRSTKTETTTLRFLDNALDPGVYRLGETPVLAINTPRDESNLAPLDRAAIPLPNPHVARDQEELARQIQEHRIGRPFSETMLWIILLLAMLELFIANRSARPRASITDTLRVNPGGRVLDKAA